LWRLSERPDKSATHAVPIREARLLGHRIDCLPRFLHQAAGSLQPQVLDRLGRRLTCLFQKDAIELPGAESGDIGQFFDAQAILKMTPGVGQDLLNSI
jgi:hypothetical protein